MLQNGCLILEAVIGRLTHQDKNPYAAYFDTLEVYIVILLLLVKNRFSFFKHSYAAFIFIVQISHSIIDFMLVSLGYVNFLHF